VASIDVKIDWYHLGHANHGITSGEAGAVAGALDNGHDPFRIGCCVVGPLQRHAHIFRRETVTNRSSASRGEAKKRRQKLFLILRLMLLRRWRSS
jgi:hypothetical protein